MPLGAIPENRDENLPRNGGWSAPRPTIEVESWWVGASPAFLWEPSETGAYPVVGSLLP